MTVSDKDKALRKLEKKAAELSLSDCRKRYEAGDKAAILSAIRLCGRYKVIIPDWLNRAFHQATNKWYRYEVKELGEAFALTWPKGAHLHAMKKKRHYKCAVYLRVCELHDRGEPIDERLFAVVGKELAIGGSTARDYYYAGKQMFAYKKSQDLL